MDRVVEEFLAGRRDPVALLYLPLALPREIWVGANLDHPVPEEQADGERYLEPSLLDRPELLQLLFDLGELEGLLGVSALVVDLDLVELAEDGEEGRPDRVRAAIDGLRDLN